MPLRAVSCTVLASVSGAQWLVVVSVGVDVGVGVKWEVNCDAVRVGLQPSGAASRDK